MYSQIKSRASLTLLISYATGKESSKVVLMHSCLEVSLVAYITERSLKGKEEDGEQLRARL